MVPPAVLLVVLMAIGSVVMWLGVPLGLIYAASRLADTPHPRMGPYLLVLIGLPLGMAIVGKRLGALDRVYSELTQREIDTYRPGWMRSMRGEREVDRRGGVLDVVMIVSRRRSPRLAFGSSGSSAVAGSLAAGGLAQRRASGSPGRVARPRRRPAVRAESRT